LVELMVVLAVMGILVSAALPSMGTAFADRRVANVARDVVSLFQRARYMSMAYGRAHRVEYMNDGGTGILPNAETFAFETLRGTSGACSSSSFKTVGGTGLADLDCGNNWRCVDYLYSHTYEADPTDTDLVRVDGWQNSSFCYEAGSNNQVFVATVLFSSWQTANAQAGFGFLAYRQLGGTPVGVARKVLIPTGTGSPRILR
jgi:type II secretory pathway pseudopilin PulG